MLHRRCLVDDGYGVAEALNDESKVTLEFYVMLDNTQNTAILRHRNQLIQYYPILPAISQINNINQYISSYTTTYSALTTSLPQNLHLLTFEIRNPTQTGISPQGDTFVLLRLQHLYEVGESIQYSVPITFNISNLFKPSILTINTLEDTILSGTLARNKLNRLKWNTKSINPIDQIYTPEILSNNKLLKDFVVTINPREIKTYRVNSSPLS